MYGQKEKHIVEVAKSDLSSVVSVVQKQITRSSFIAVDLEFTGMGDNKESTQTDDLEDRYKAICEIVKRQAILEFGLSLFHKKEEEKEEDKAHLTYEVQTFNFMMLRQDVFEVTPRSMTFLAEHGLDFNRLFMSGIPYYPGKYDSSGDSNNLPSQILMRLIFDHLIQSQKPFVLHNGLFDLLFLYFSFRDELPESLSEFIHKIIEIFPITYDTKYIAEFHRNEPASFLQYLFHKCDRLNRKKLESVIKGERNFSILKVIPTVEPSLKSCCRVGRPQVVHVPRYPSVYCSYYARFGACRFGNHCRESHDINLILDKEERKYSHKRSRKNGKNGNNGKRKTKLDDLNSPNPKRHKTEELRLEGLHLVSESEKKKQGDENNGTPSLQTSNASTNPSSATTNAESEEPNSEVEEGSSQTNADSVVELEDGEIQKPVQIDLSVATGSSQAPELPVDSTSDSPTNSESTADAAENGNVNTSVQESNSNGNAGIHSAGHDAYMTGFIMGFFHTEFEASELSDLKNKIHLTGKDYPLLLKTSLFGSYK